MTEIILYGIIGSPDDKCDAATVCAAIRAGRGPLSIRLNSAGGYVMEGLAIVAAMRAYQGGQITAYIDGLAASMASVIASAADEVVMAESALWMCHKPWDASIGNADEMRKDAEQLDRVEAQIIGIYAKRSGLEHGELAGMLADETWLTPEEALAKGFVTSIAAPLKIAAIADLTPFGFRHVPANLTGKEHFMPPTTPSADTTQERQRISSIMSLCSKHGLPDTLRAELVDRGTSLDVAREIILDRLATRDDALNIGHGNPNEQTWANPVFTFNAMQDALFARVSGEAPSAPAKELMGLSLIDMARDVLDRQGVSGARLMSPKSVLDTFNGRGKGGAKRAQASAAGGWMGSAAITHGTGDFPDLLTGTGDRYLAAQFALASNPLKKVARKTNAKDFREKKSIIMSEFSQLDETPEFAEVKHGTMQARSEGYKPATFTKQFTLSRQAIMNDDLGAFADTLRIMARSAAETEATILAALLNSNPIMSDGNALFSAAHGNLIATGSGSAPTVASFDAARVKLATQRDPNSGAYLEVAPSIWLGPTALGGAARVVNGSQYDPDVANKLQRANVALGMLDDVIDTPRLTNQTAWYLFADPEQYPVLEYCYIDGVEEPKLDSKEGWDVLGMAYRVVHDFGAGFVDWRGAVKNEGA